MRTVKAIVSLIILTLLLCCKKDAAKHQPLVDLLRSGGQWTVSDYTLDLDTGIHLHTGTTLIFQTDGKMNVQAGSQSGTGTWTASSFGDGEMALMMLSIDLESDHFSHLEYEWLVLTLNPTLLELSSGGFVSSKMTLSKN